MAGKGQDRAAGKAEKGVLSALPHHRPGVARTARAARQAEGGPTADGKRPNGRATGRRPVRAQRAATEGGTAKRTRTQRRKVPRQGYEVEEPAEVRPALGAEVIGWVIDQLAGGSAELLRGLEERGEELVGRVLRAVGLQ